MSDTEAPKVFVAFALELEEARHAFGAIRVVFQSCAEAGRPPAEYAPLARAMHAMAEAIDRKNGDVGVPSESEVS